MKRSDRIKQQMKWCAGWCAVWAMVAIAALVWLWPAWLEQMTIACCLLGLVVGNAIYQAVTGAAEVRRLWDRYLDELNYEARRSVRPRIW